MIASSIAVLALVLAPNSALAAPLLIGSPAIGAPAGLYTCGGNFNLVQSTSPAGLSYSVPATGGVITSWSTTAGGYTAPVRLQVWRKAVGYMTYTLVGASPVVTLTGMALNTFNLAPADQITVAANDVLGLRIEAPTTNTGLCGEYAAGGAYGFLLGAQPAAGVATPFTQYSSMKINVSATVEAAGTLPLPPPPDPAPGTGTGCNSSANANLTDACGVTQTLIHRLLAAAIKAANA